MCVYVCVCVCMRVSLKENENERRIRDAESVCVSVCVCVCVFKDFCQEGEDNRNEIQCCRYRSLLLIVCLNSQTSEFAAKATSFLPPTSISMQMKEFFIISL